MENKQLKEKLFYSKKNVFEVTDADAAYKYAVDYMRFLDVAKTERESVCEGIKMAEAAGFRPYKFGDKISVGDKLYYNNRDKNLFLFTIGSEPVENGIRIAAAPLTVSKLVTT